MFTDFLPLALTAVDWKTLQQFDSEITRGHDKSNITLDDPAAYAAALSGDQKPLENLRNKQRGFAHVHVSFIGTTTDGVLIDLVALTRIRIHKLPKAVILTASLDEWKSALLDCCQLMTSYELRCLFTDIYFYFYRTLFREMFYGAVVVEHTDKTVLIR